MAYIKTVNRAIMVLETIEEIYTLLSLKKWLKLTEVHRHIYEFADKPDEIKYTDVIVNRDHIVEITT